MAKTSAIAKYACQDIVAAGQRAGRSYDQIAKECSEWAGVNITKRAVQCYIESLPEKKKEVVVENKQAIINVVHQDFDIIQTSLSMTKRLMARFEVVDNLPEYFQDKVQDIVEWCMTGTLEQVPIAALLEKWYPEVEGELRRKIYEIATLNKEMRENMKFLVTLREKAFEFDLIQEYLQLFMQCFAEESTDGAYERALQRVASNPRMLQIVEQQQARTNAGGDS